MQINKISKDEALYQQALDLRYQLFFKVHKLPKKILYDELEMRSIHIAISEDEKLIAYGRLSALKNNIYKISQMVVAHDYQGNGFGSKLLSTIMDYARREGAVSIVLNARISALKLYTKHGFNTIGSVYLSENTKIPHVAMEYNTLS